tara:strand:- start:89 stop:865 length:777 start_codon:yes stop_codon:yes gene_type:complete
MPNPRELSQFGSFVEVNDTTKNIGIATTGTPFVGIGTLTPEEKLHVVGNLRVDGDTNFDRLVVGVLTASSVVNPNLTVENLTVSTAATITTAEIPGTLNVGVVTGATYYGDAQYLDNVGLAVTYIDNDLLVDGTITADNIILSGGGQLGADLTIANVVVTGVGTIGGVQLGPSGIVTAGAGTTTVVYYGDGYNITNIQASALTGFQVAIHRRPASGRWTMGQNITKINVAADDTFEVSARSGIVTVSIGDAALPPLTV